MKRPSFMRQPEVYPWAQRIEGSADQAQRCGSQTSAVLSPASTTPKG